VSIEQSIQKHYRQLVVPYSHQTWHHLCYKKLCKTSS
jgi:hypothetical protein